MHSKLLSYVANGGDHPLLRVRDRRDKQGCFAAAQHDGPTGMAESKESPFARFAPKMNCTRQNVLVAKNRIWV